jgi:hypothetical protein
MTGPAQCLAHLCWGRGRKGHDLHYDGSCKRQAKPSRHALSGGGGGGVVKETARLNRNEKSDKVQL